MPQSPEDQDPSHLERKLLRIDFGALDFPSDALSVKRLRHIFPELFEEGSLTGGYGGFFFPLGHERPPYLVLLNNLLSAERTLADYAFYNALDPYPSETLDEECHWCAEKARSRLQQLYLDFKLADSPETARLLIRHVEEQGTEQAARIKDRTR
jgi:hypothetical protein